MRLFFGGSFVSFIFAVSFCGSPSPVISNCIDEMSFSLRSIDNLCSDSSFV
jgi:hypothetical protein